MLKLLPVTDLAPGMYTVDSGISWLERPYLFSSEAVLDEAIIARIAREGYQEAFIDTDRSRPNSLPDYLSRELGMDKIRPSANRTPRQLLSFDEELPAAANAYKSCLDKARVLVDGMRSGQVPDYDVVEPVVDGMLESLGRNTGAMASLCKLRSADEYTYTHCVNVAVFGVMLAKQLGLGQDEQKALGFAGLFHDLGKSRIPLDIINAPRKLTAEEFEIMREHPKLGFTQIKNSAQFSDIILKGVLEHHERHNGKGYPHGLAGDEISQAGSILAVADVYDALSSRRSYKEAMPTHRALGIMYQMRNEDFRPGYIEELVRLLGVYPLGSVVELADKRKAVVCLPNEEFPAKPSVIMAKDPLGRRLKPEVRDIAKGECPPITRCLAEGETDIDAAALLGIPVV